MRLSNAVRGVLCGALLLLGAAAVAWAQGGYHLLKKCEFGRGFITDGAQAKVIIIYLKTLKVTGEAKADKDADSVAYDPASKRVFVMNGDPHSATVVDAKSGSVVG